MLVFGSTWGSCGSNLYRHDLVMDKTTPIKRKSNLPILASNWLKMSLANSEKSNKVKLLPHLKLTKSDNCSFCWAQYNSVLIVILAREHLSLQYSHLPASGSFVVLNLSFYSNPWTRKSMNNRFRKYFPVWIVLQKISDIDKIKSEYNKIILSPYMPVFYLILKDCASIIHLGGLRPKYYFYCVAYTFFL